MAGPIRTTMAKLKVRKAILANNPVDHYYRFYSTAVPVAAVTVSKRHVHTILIVSKLMWWPLVFY